mmetsp:Transcript_16123/g.47920  ORF Transcript_16123/g.47920 Transcript_16123/m.47920 type:complete len:107 (-) Transcript_16123:612-932(-)
MQAPAPNRLDSVVVTNKSDGEVDVTVVFDNHKDKVELAESHKIAPGQSWHFEEKTLDMGSWKAVAPVTKVSVSHSNGLHELAPSINGVVKKLDMHVGSNGQLEQGV